MARILLWSLALLYVLGAAGWIVQAGFVRERNTSETSDIELLNVACDPTRELWQDLNPRFAAEYFKDTGRIVSIKQSHGGSGSQARSVVDGLNADVITLALWTDTDTVRKGGLLDDNWESKLPNRSLPYVSTIVFVVRKGNPENIKDWPDLIQGDPKTGVQVITPNPKTSGNGKWSFLAAWGSVTTRGGTEAEAREYVKQLYAHVPVLDTAARAATMTFKDNGIGDVHLTWENEAHLEVLEAKGELEIVYPPVSILAEPHVAVVDKHVRRKGTEHAARAYMAFLYTDEAQEVIAKHYYRPTNPAIKEKTKDRFPDIKLFGTLDVGPSWDAVQKRFFASTPGAVFDEVFAEGRKK